MGYNSNDSTVFSPNNACFGPFDENNFGPVTAEHAPVFCIVPVPNLTVVKKFANSTEIEKIEERARPGQAARYSCGALGAARQGKCGPAAPSIADLRRTCVRREGWSESPDSGQSGIRLPSREAQQAERTGDPTEHERPLTRRDDASCRNSGHAWSRVRAADGRQRYDWRPAQRNARAGAREAAAKRLGDIH